MYNVSRRLSDLECGNDSLDAARQAGALARKMEPPHDRLLIAALLQEARCRPAAERLALTEGAIAVARRLAVDTVLARALSHHGDSLAGAGQTAEARDAYRGSLEILAASFPQLPNYALQLVSATQDDYKSACRRSAMSPEQKLIAPMEQFFAR